MANGTDGDIKLSVTLSDAELRQSARRLRSEIKSIFDNAAGREVSESFQKLQEKMARVSGESRKVAKEMDALRNKKVPTEQYSALEKELAKVNMDAERVNARIKKFQDLGGNTKSNAFRSMQYDAVQISDKLYRINQQMEQLRSTGKAFTLGSTTQEYANLQERQGSLLNTMTLLVNKAHQLGEAGESSGRRFSSSLTELSTKFATAAKSAAKLAWEVAKITGKGIMSLASKLRGLVGHFRSNTKAAQGFNAALSFKKILMYGFGIRSLYFLFKRLRGAIKEGLQNMAQFNDGNNSLNRSLSQLMSSLQYLKNSWASAFAPVINFVMPVLTRLMDAISKAAQTIGAFFAMLTGKSTFLRAKKNYVDYASTLSSNSDKATKSVKKLKAELYGFDELNQQQDKDNGDTGAGGGAGGGISPNDMFEEVPVTSMLSDYVQDWIKRLKEAWKKGDWEGVGLIIAEGLNHAMKIADNWINNKFRPWGVKWASRIARILNGVVEGLDWKLLGKLVADGLNAVFDIANTFLTTFKWEKFGRGLGNSIKPWLDHTEWDLIAQTFANRWNAFIKTIHGIVTTPGIWKSMGDSIATFVNNWFSTIEWKKLVDNITHIVNGIVYAFRRAIKQIDFMSAGKEFSDRIIQFFHDINWKSIGKLITELAQRVMMFLVMVDWSTIGKELGKALGDLVSNINYAQIIAMVALLVVQLGVGVLQAILSFLQTVYTKFGEIAKKAGVDAVSAYFNAWASAMNTGTKVIATVFTGFMNTIKGVLNGQISVLKVIGSVLVNSFSVGIIPTLYALVTDIKTIINGLIKFFTTAWNTVKTTALNIWRAITNGITSLINNLVNGVTTRVNNLKSRVISAFKSLKSTVNSVVSALVSNVSNKWTTLKTRVVSRMTSLVSSVLSKWRNLKSLMGHVDFSSIGRDMVMGLLHGLQSAWQQVTSWASNAASSVANTMRSALRIHSPSKVFADIGENITAGLLQGVQAGEPAVEKEMVQLTKTVVVSAKNTKGKKSTKASAKKSSKSSNQNKTTASTTLLTTISSNVVKLLSSCQSIAKAMPKTTTATNFTTGDNNDIIEGDFSKISSDLTNAMVTLAQMGSLLYDIHQIMTQVPSVAQGRVVPPGSAVSGGQNDETGLTNTLVNAIQTALMNVEANRTGEQANQQQVVRIDINGREVFNAVVRENNKALLRTGSSPLIA